MSSLSPRGNYTNNAERGDHGSGYSDEGRSDKSTLSMSLGFLKNLTEKKSTRVDGQTPKKRGPKPDSKPALTRRQELNRQAQRTHRERKEIYIKALEQEVLRLKENFSTVTRSKESLAEENRQLKQLLAQHGIPWNGTGGVVELQQRNASVGYTSSGSVSGSYAPGSTSYSPPPGSHSSNLNPGNMQYNHGSPPEFGASNNMNGRSMAQQQVQPGVDYDQAGIDFVLTLERPCMDHMQFLMERASDPEGEIWCGHALMATCPPEADIEQHPDIPFGHCLPHVNKSEPQKTWDLSKSDLSNLLDLSKRLDLNGEITPVMAWGMVLAHPRLSELKEKDFKAMSEDLLPKVRCYGFGAALEDFEVRDALEALFSMDTSPGMVHYMS